MLHFFPRFTDRFAETPYAAELERLGVPHRFFGAGINLRYASTAGLLLGVYPRLLWFALRSAVQSLLLSRPAPAAAIIGTDVEALIFGVIRLVFRRRTDIVFETFISTPRRSPVANALYQRYFALITRLIDVAVCHSSREIAHYADAFPRAKCRFVFVPFGMTMEGRAALMEAASSVPDEARAIVTAGRSGRDYPTLARAIDGLPCRLRIVCDIAAPVVAVAPSDQITIVRDCFDDDYLLELAKALFVVVPLAVDDISAGQMVLLQAAALGRAVIVTRTATTPEYAMDGEDALLVDRSDVPQMRALISRLLDDPAARKKLGARAEARFERKHSTEAYVRALVSVLIPPKADADDIGRASA